MTLDWLILRRYRKNKEIEFREIKLESYLGLTLNHVTYSIPQEFHLDISTIKSLNLYTSSTQKLYTKRFVGFACNLQVYYNNT